MRLTKQEFLEKYNELITEQQINNLSFDYFNQDYPNRKRLPKEDLQFLFLDLNLSKQEIALLTNCSYEKVKSCIYHYKLKKTPEQSIAVQKRTCIEKYGVYCSAMAEETKQKAKKTCLQRYGVENPAQVKEFKEKYKQTCLKKYGYSNSTQNEEVKKKISDTYKKSTKQKIEKTCLEKYGATSYWGSSHMNWEEAVKKTKETCKKKYGVDNIMKLPQTVEKAKQTNIEKYGADWFLITKEGQKKSKETCIERYGVPVSSQNEFVKQKIKQTCVERYGTDKIMSLPQFQEKANNTKKKNKSNSKDSKDERKIFEMLNTKFKDVDWQHYDKQRYPFRCDFYIQELDLFIEYQGHQGHGKHPFNPNNDLDIQKVEEWKLKSEEINYKGEKKKQYRDYIKTWTIRDVKKREIAKKNNLNWLEFFSMDEFIQWFNTI